MGNVVSGITATSTQNRHWGHLTVPKDRDGHPRRGEGTLHEPRPGPGATHAYYTCSIFISPKSFQFPILQGSRFHTSHSRKRRLREIKPHDHGDGVGLRSSRQCQNSPLCSLCESTRVSSWNRAVEVRAPPVRPLSRPSEFRSGGVSPPFSATFCSAADPRGRGQYQLQRLLGLGGNQTSQRPRAHPFQR